MKVLIVGSECTPLVKVGGLGDVVGALPKALEKEGIEIAVCIPFYDVIDREKYRSGIIGTFSVEFHDEKHDLLFHYFTPKILSGELTLSPDHSDFKWISKEEMKDFSLHPSVKLFLE